MNCSLLSLSIVMFSLLLLTACQKKFDFSSANNTGNFGSFSVGSNLTYIFTQGASLPDTFTLTVTDKDTAVNGKTYKVLTRSDGFGNTYLAKINNDYFHFAPLPGIGVQSLEELYLKDKVPVNSTWSNSIRAFTMTGPFASLIGKWKMDEGSGTTLIDASNYRNDATTEGDPLWVTGVTGQALSLDGTSQYAAVPDDASLDITGSITLAAWIRPKKQALQNIIKKAIIGSENGYELSLSTEGNVFFRFNQTTSLDSFRLNSTGSYPDDGETWMHIAATYDGSSIIKIYINGVENASKALTAPPPINTNALSLVIGAQSDASRKFFGTIDDVRIYNSALSAAQIRNFIYSNVSDTLTANLRYTVKEKSVTHVVKGKMYSNVTHIRLDITVGSNLDIGGGDFYYAPNIGLIENNIELTPPGQSSFTSKQELIAYEIK